MAANAEESEGRTMIIMGAGICQWFHGDATYRAILVAAACSPARWDATAAAGRTTSARRSAARSPGWATMAMALDWSRPPRQMIGTAFWYTHTDQWRYDGYRADALASPLAEGQLAGMHTADTIAQSARLGWMPSYPQFDRNPLDLADEVAAAGADAGRVRRRRSCAAGRLRFAAEDPDAPENWPRVLTLWRANLLGSSSKGNEYFLKHLLGTHSSLRAERDPAGPPPARRDLARRGARGQARPAGRRWTSG